MTIEEKYNLLISELRRQSDMTKPSGYDAVINMDEDFSVDDYAAGNIDDAYEIGREHGLYEGVEWIKELLNKVE